MQPILFQSTRDDQASCNFADVILAGLAPDGGLYVPKCLPHFTAHDLHSMRTYRYGELADQIFAPFTTGLLPDEFASSLMRQAAMQFSHHLLAPLRQIGQNQWLLELFHGPTLAFKDFGMQMLAGYLDHLLEERDRRLTILSATSGDTGAAAIHACKGSRRIRIIMLHPKGRIAAFQRAQMTTVMDDNVHNIAIDGSFDDCQDLVKAMFTDTDGLREKLALGTVNSINWGRILAQAVYYFQAGLSLGAPERTVSFVVPSGNFGNIYAAWLAGQMGLPIGKLVVASNRNDILTRFFQHNEMSIRPVEASLSPSMDIQISSNFERLLFATLDRDSKATQSAIHAFRQTGKLTLDQAHWQKLRQQFCAFYASDDATLRQIKSCFQETSLMVDPHSAVGLHAASEALHEGMVDHTQPLVTVATAHPAKFPDAIHQALGFDAKRPAAFDDIEQRPERCVDLPNDPKRLKAFLFSCAGA